MIARLDALIAPWLGDDAPGGVVAVARDGELVLQRVFGSASLEQSRPNTPQTRFPIGSVTKHMTAAAVLELEKRGILSFDDTIRRWLPELPHDATLRQLARHTAGFRCYLDIAFSDGFATQPPGAGLAAQARQHDVNFAPGTSQCYSNGGYLLLSLAIERATGRAFEHVLHELLFAPLGLAATFSQRADAPIRAGIACGHVPLAAGGWARGVSVSDERLGDGSVISTATDLLAWARHLRRSGLLDALAPDRPGYGLGLMREAHRGIELVGHGGGVMGANSHLFVAPALGLEVVALCNGPAPARALALAALEHVVGEALAPVPASPASDPHRSLLGHYRVAATGMVFELADRDGGLALGMFGSPPQALASATPAEPGRLPFALAGATGPLFFAQDGDGLNVVVAGEAMAAQRLDPAGASLPPGVHGCAAAAATWHVHAPDAAGEQRIEARGAYGFNTFVARPWAGGLVSVRHAWMPWFAIARPLDAGTFELSTARTWRLRFERRAP